MFALKKMMIVFICSLMTACVSVNQGPMYSQKNSLQSGETGIYIYTTEFHPFAHGFVPEIYLDGKLLGTLPNGAYSYLRVSSGSHVLSVKYKNTIITSRTNELPFILHHRQVKYFEGKWEYASSHGMMFVTGKTSAFAMMPEYEWRLYPVSEQNGGHSVTQLTVSQQ